MTASEFAAWFKTASLQDKQALAAAMVNPIKNCRVVYPKRYLVAGGYGPYKPVWLK